MQDLSLTDLPDVLCRTHKKTRWGLLFLPPSRPSRLDLLIAKPAVNHCHRSVLPPCQHTTLQRYSSLYRPSAFVSYGQECVSAFHQWGQLIRVDVAVKGA